MPRPTEDKAASEASTPSSLRRIDWLGTISIAIAVISAMILIDMGGRKFPWRSPYTAVFASLAAANLILFFITEACIAKEPIFPLHLLKNKDVVLSYLMSMLQLISQSSMMFLVPLYFGVTANASDTVGGAHLVPAVMGNAIGGILAGVAIKRTGRYKLIAVAAGLVASITYILLLFRWHGNTGFWESLYIIPGGFGTGLVQSVTFVSMAAALEPQDIAMGTSGLFLLVNIGLVIGVTSSSSILKQGFHQELVRRVTGPDADEVSQHPAKMEDGERRPHLHTTTPQSTDTTDSLKPPDNPKSNVRYILHRLPHRHFASDGDSVLCYWFATYL